MTEENQKRHDEKAARMRAALQLQEPDRVPISIGGGAFAYVDAGYTVAEINYDESLEKAKDAIKRFLTTYDPDVGSGLALSFAGEGPGHEMQGCSTLFIAGMKNAPIHISDNSGPQFLEQVMLPDEELELTSSPGRRSKPPSKSCGRSAIIIRTTAPALLRRSGRSGNWAIPPSAAAGGPWCPLTSTATPSAASSTR